MNEADAMKTAASIFFYGGMVLLVIAAYLSLGMPAALLVLAVEMFVIAIATFAKFDDSWQEVEG
jgi:hypothetical protein